MEGIGKKVEKIKKLYKDWESKKALLRANIKFAKDNEVVPERDLLITNLQRRINTIERELKNLVK